MTPLSLLLVDDDAELSSMMQEFFARAGHQLECAHNGKDGLALALQAEYDLILLDVMLPVINGFTVLDQIRRRSNVPIIMLTARIHPRDRVQGLNRGADDYLAKPFDPDELLARVRAVLRRSATTANVDSTTRTVADIQVNYGAREVWYGSHVLDLTALEFDILDLLIRSAGRTVPREEIMTALFERQATPYDRSLDVHISHLRKKLQPSRVLIRTVRGVGYVFAVGAENGA